MELIFLEDGIFAHDCVICNKCISSYVCYRVGHSMYIHETCSVKFPKEVTHPFHPHHPLNLRKLRPNQYCSMCKRWIEHDCAYSCFDCGYHLDFKCASLTPVKDHQNLCNLPDSLIPCRRGLEYLQYCCTVCDESIEGDVYFDSDSKRLLHESCYNLPEEINHPFHPSHPLTLVQRPGGHHNTCYCYACGKASMSDYFGCLKCGFYLDVHCAFLAPTNKIYESSHDVRGLSHQHPLIECSLSTTSVRILCSACQNPCKGGLVYVCIDCHFVVEESCMGLPRQLQHPLHLEHPLTLYRPSTFSCHACNKRSRCFIYACLVCCVQIDIKCAWSVLPCINSQYHQHPLVFLDKSYSEFEPQYHRQRCMSLYKYCDHCRKWVNAPLLFCLQCGYYLHLHCLPELPRVLKHESHLYPLSFTDSSAEDHPDKDEQATATLYCNVCGERRKLRDPTYYCADCHFVAHIDCLIPEILQQLQISSEKTICEEFETNCCMANATMEVENQDADNDDTSLDEDSKDPVVEGQHLFAELKSEIASIDKEKAELNKQLKALDHRREVKVDQARFVASILHLSYDS